MKKAVAILCLVTLFASCLASNTLTIKLFDKASKEPVADAYIYASDSNGKSTGAVSDDNGTAKLMLCSGEYTIYISHIQYETQQTSIRLENDLALTFYLQKKNYQLGEVVVTASESKKIGSVSTIGRDAMSHLQPTSIGDLMELLPGGVSQTPSLTQGNSISLRETGSLGSSGQKLNSSQYSTNSLGTLFVVDGAPINTDANMQYMQNGGFDGMDMTNRGVDMRTISTDDIESIEVMRGIPSVEYGNLTSGVVNIKKIRKPTKLNARFKADDKSQLLSLGKGFALDSSKSHILNIDGGLLNAYADIRNPLEEYKRANLSARLTSTLNKEKVTLKITPSAEYTGSFDNYKTDENLSYSGINTFKSTYHKLAVGNGISILPNANGHYQKTVVNMQLTQEFDNLERRVLVAPSRAGIAPSSNAPGEYDAYLLFSEYVANYRVDGKPFTAFAKTTTDFEFNSQHIVNALKFGAEWNMSKNFGKGQIYDLSHPLSTKGWGSRPRQYNEIPASHTLSLYVQDYITARIGRHLLEARIGARSTSILGLTKEYAMHGKFYIDPRINLQWTLPHFGEKQWSISFSGGIGRTTKMPTMNYLYPDANYIDIIQLAYYNQSNPAEFSRYNILSYKEDATNYALQPARNLKGEFRVDFEIEGYRLWVCVFDEKMSSGFRYSSTYTAFDYKDYDETTIDANLAARPELADISYEARRILGGYSFVENGSRQDKVGIEWEFSSARIKPLCTAIKFSGAWFRSIYVNSRPMFYPVSSVVDNVVISNNYIGLYDWNDGRINEQLSTNLFLDTQIPKLKLIFSTSVQAMWFVSTKRMEQNCIPVQYLSVADGQLHDYTDEAVAENPLLRHLVYNLSESAYEKYTIPPAIYINLKVTKNIGKWLSMSLFVNKLLDYTPDFRRNDVLIRRNATPYFGMEINMKI